MATRVIQSSRGTFKFKNASLDTNGTDLVDGLDVYQDDEHIGEIYGYYDLEDCDGDKLIKLAFNLENSF